MTTTDDTTPAAPAPRKTARPRKKPVSRRKTRPARPASARNAERRLATLLGSLASTASRTGLQIAELSGKGASAARRAVGKAGSASRKAAARAVREWKKMDTPRKVEFTVTLLSALAAATGAIARSRKKR